MSQSREIAASSHVARVDGHIGEPATAARIVETALSRFKSIDALVNNAGIFFAKPFTDYTADDFESLVSTELSSAHKLKNRGEPSRQTRHSSAGGPWCASRFRMQRYIWRIQRVLISQQKIPLP